MGEGPRSRLACYQLPCDSAGTAPRQKNGNRRHNAMHLIRRVSLGGSLVLVALLGCATFNPVDPLRPRVAFDLHCADGQITFTPLSGDCFKEHLTDAADKLPKYYTCT